MSIRDGLPACCYAPDGAGLAHELYAAYNRGGERKGLNFQGNPCPEWQNLPEDVREKWCVVAEHASAYYGMSRAYEEELSAEAVRQARQAMGVVPTEAPPVEAPAELPPVVQLRAPAPPPGTMLGIDGMCVSNLDGEEALAALQAGVALDTLVALAVPPQQISMGVDPRTSALVLQCLFAFPPNTFKAQGASLLVAASGQSAQRVDAFFAPLPRGDAPGARVPPRGEGIPRLRVVTSLGKLTSALRKQITGA